MSKQLNINLGFTADTSQAKQQIMELRNNLNELTTSSITKNHLPLTESIMEAQSAAASLKVALDGAINTNTGKLDLSKFSTSLSKAGLDLKTLQAHLLKLGPTGASTFQSLATSIMRAEVPLTRTNVMMTNLWTTMKNTARWQLSSSMLHGFMSTISSAFGYAKDLESSLNNIRIVTSNSVEEMARFAEQANKAAKALHTTTTAYTDASLIYYQQGLSEDEVKKRADITIKMANVSRQNAEVVSDQLTAVWNNFYDGTKTLEYYADVMTALGAATASSSEEIATGLEKFAATAETVGLSYEYATAALATVTATTRQSADVVGTAFKTLFARLNDLKLGETLDDGTTLGQYTENLAKVGVNIKDANDQLKNMDQILTETAAKWDTLNRDQQTALAKGVAGIRQYSQFIALMDNWDFMEENLKTVGDSSGTLSEQAEIFGESWEAAANRVKASAEDVYDSLIDDDAIKNLMEGFAGVLDTVANLIDAMGGLPGVLSLIGIMMTKAFGPQLAASIERMAYNVKSLMGINARQATATQDQAYALASDMNYTAGTEAGAAEAKVMGDQLKLQNALRENAQNMTEEERKRFEALMEINRAYGEQAILAAKAKDAAISNANETSGDIRKKVMRMDTSSGMDDKAKAQTYTKAREEMKKLAAEAATAQLSLEKVNAKLSAGGAINISGYNKQLEQVASTFDELGRTDVGDKIREAMASFKTTGDMTTFQQTIQEIINSDELLADATMKASDKFRDFLISAGFSNEEIQKLMGDTDKLAAEEIELALRTKQAGEAMKGAGTNAEQLRQKIEGYKKAMQSWSQTIVSAFNGIASLSMALSSFKGLIDTLNNEDMTFGEKLLQSMTSLGMAVPALMFSLKGIADLVKLVRAAFNAETVSKGLNTAATILQEAAERKLKDTKEKSAKATKKNKKETDKETISKATNAGVTKLKDGFKNLGKGIGDWFKAYKGVLGKVGLVAAGIAIAAVSVSAAIKHYNKDRLAAEQAAKNAQQAAEMYQSMSESYDKFTSSIESYDTAVKGLKDLQKGTLEYREAVLKANESVLELIRNNKNLKYDVDDQGLIIIDPGSLEDAKRTQLEILQNAQATKMIAEQTAKDTQLRADQTDFNRRYAKGSGWSSEDTAWMGGSIGAGLGGGLAVGAMIGGSAGPIGAAIGAIAGLIVGTIGALAGNDSEKEEDEALEILKDAYNKQGNAIFTEGRIQAELGGKVSKDLIDSLIKNVDETEQMVTAMSANEAATLALTEALLREEDPDKFDNKKLSQENIDKLWTLTSKDVEKKKSELYNTKYKDMGKFGGGLSDSYVQKEYARLMGWDPNLVKNQGDNQAIYYNQDGQEVKLSDETVRMFLANEEAKQQSSDEDATREQSMLNLQEIVIDNNKKFGHVLTSLVDDDSINNATQADINFILEGQADELVSEGILKSLGYEKEEYLTALKEGADLYGKQLVEAQQELTNTLNGAILNGIENLTLEDTKMINDLLLTLSPGQKKKFLEDYNNLIDSAGEENQAELIQALFDVDWNSIDSVEEFQKKLLELGSDIRITNDDWLEFQNNLKRGTGVPALDTIISAFKQIQFYTEVQQSNKNRDLTTEEFNKLDETSKENYSIIEVDDQNNPTKYRYTGNPIKDEKQRTRTTLQETEAAEHVIGTYEDTYTQDQIDVIADGVVTKFDQKTTKYTMKDPMYMNSATDVYDGNAPITIIDPLGKERETTAYYYSHSRTPGDDAQGWTGSQEEAKYKQYHAYVDAGIIKENDIPLIAVDAKDWDSTLTTDYEEFESSYGSMTTGKYFRRDVGGWKDLGLKYIPDVESEEWKKIVEEYGDYTEAQTTAGSNVNQAYASTAKNAFALEYDYGAMRHISQEHTDKEKSEDVRANTSYLENYSKGLRAVVAVYDSCQDELYEYNKAIHENRIGSEEAEKAEKKLVNAIKDANWNQATKEVEEYMNAWKDTTDPEEKAAALQGITNSLFTNLGAAVDPAWVEQNIALIQQWFNATGDKATSVATKIQALGTLAGMTSAEIKNALVMEPVDIDFNEDGVIDEADTVLQKYDILKSIIENNPIIIDGDGNIDVTKLVAALVGAGATAQGVADILASIGQTDISISGWGDAVDPKTFDLSKSTDQETFGEYIKSITNWEGGVLVTGGYVPKQGVTDMSKVGDTKTSTKKKNRTIREKLKDDRDRTDLDKETERYYKITNEIEDLNRELDQLSDAKDDAWGSDKLAAMDKEIAKLKQVKKATESYRDEIANKLIDDEKVLSEYGASFDENGIVSNYEALMESWANEKDSIIVDKYNEYEKQIVSLRNQAQNIDDDTDADGSKRNALEDQIEDLETQRDNAVKDAEDLYNKRKESLKQYEQTRDLLAETNAELEEQRRQIQQLNYEKLEYKIEIQVELNENDITDIEHQLERLGDNNIYASAERLAVIQKNAVSYRNIADAQMEAIKEAERLYAANEISQENYMARLQESKEALQDAEKSIRSGIQQIGEELSNTFNLVDEKLEQQFTKFDQMIKLMDHYKKVVSLTQGEASYKEFNKILKASQEVLRNRIAADESEVAMWTARKEQLETEMKGMDKNSPEYLAAEEALNNIMKKEADAKSQLMTDIEQLGEYAQEIFENAIEQAKIDFEEAMFGGSLSSVIESIEMLNAKQEEVLTTTNKIYETNKLIRNVEKDIEATTNKRAKQAYAEFQNKVKQKQEQNELIQFELDLLNAEYEITKAQIALEEAQNAKDTVRLTRDNEGNYGYVYTANEDKIADAEQALDDATNNYYNTALEGAQKYQDQIYQHIEEWEEKVTEVMKDQTLSEEEKNKKIAEINATYDEMIRRDKQLYYIAIDGIRDSSYNTQVDYDLKGIESAENWFDECDGFIEGLKTAQDEYDTNTQEVAQHTEDNFGKMEASIENTKIESEKLKDHIVDELVPELETTLKDSIDNATEAWQKYIEALQEVIRLTDEAMKKNHDTQLTEAYKEDYAAEISKRLANGADYNDYDIQQLLQARWDKMGGVDNTDYQALINAGGTPEQIALWEVLRRFKIDKTDWSSSDASYADEIRATKMDQDFAQLIINYLKSSSHARWSDETVQSYLAARQAKIDEKHESAKGAISNEELKIYVAQLLNKKPEQLKTGGYTGSWGPEGRLAVLHEKELVLNAEDTKNFLTATQMLREISDMLDHNALVASLGAINLSAMTVNSAADQILQQEVTIHADFPNVTDHNEIEMAIDNLINAASQHAFKS